MIGTGLKKLAKQYEMKVDAGIAYGLLKGYATALSEGAGYKQITISTTFPEMGQKEKLMAMTASAHRPCPSQRFTAWINCCRPAEIMRTAQNAASLSNMP